MEDYVQHCTINQRLVRGITTFSWINRSRNRSGLFCCKWTLALYPIGLAIANCMMYSILDVLCSIAYRIVILQFHQGLIQCLKSFYHQNVVVYLRTPYIQTNFAITICGFNLVQKGVMIWGFVILSSILLSQPELVSCLIRWTGWVVWVHYTAPVSSLSAVPTSVLVSEGEWEVHVSWGGMCVSFIASLHCLSSPERKGLVCLCGTKYPFHNLPGPSNTLFAASRKLFSRKNTESDCLGRYTETSALSGPQLTAFTKHLNLFFTVFFSFILFSFWCSSSLSSSFSSSFPSSSSVSISSVFS